MKKLLVNYVREIQQSSDNRNLIDRSVLSAYNRYRGFKKKLRGADEPAYNRLYLKSRNLKRNLNGTRFKFVSIDQASIWTLEWIKSFPKQYDLIVGVPRSGMLIASIIALKLGKGLTTPELLQRNEFWHSSFINEKLSFDEIKRVLVVDDSVDTGRTTANAMSRIQSMSGDIQITTASLVVRDEAISYVDLYHKIIAPPRVFEWNILHRKIASYWGHGVLAIDLDGVLCEDCPQGVDNDEKLYLDWIRNAKPYLIPAFEVDAIVTNRLEMYRQETEQWLKENNVKYKTLRMWNVPKKSDRNGNFASYKIDELSRLKPDMFWESNWSQSQEIWAETKIPTLCIKEMTLLS